jgi:hypothetical protein
LFWKNNNNAIVIEFDSDDRRSSVRINPLEPLFLKCEDAVFPIQDISATGLAFKADSPLASQNPEISIQLPPNREDDIKAYDLFCTLEIISYNDCIYHCQFIALTYENQSALDKFILNEQKRQIRVNHR